MKDDIKDVSFEYEKKVSGAIIKGLICVFIFLVFFVGMTVLYVEMNQKPDPKPIDREKYIQSLELNAEKNTCK